MEIINRNFFRLLRSGSLNEFVALEPMSTFKWNRLFEMLKAQDVVSIALRGVKNYQYDETASIPKFLIENFSIVNNGTTDLSTRNLSNPILNIRLKRIQYKERHAIDTSVETLQLLEIIVDNISRTLNHGIPIKGLLNLGKILRTQGDHVDFVKLDTWLQNLHLRRMAQLQGSIIITVFNFENSEIPFVQKIEPKALSLTMRAVNNIAMDTAKEWHFHQSRSGFVKNNSSVMRRNLRRSFRFVRYAPTETISNFINNFIKSLSEIEE
jgi:hypothetical protein